MSKQVEANATCPDCNHVWRIQLYRSLWVEDRKNRQLVADDKVNVVTCPKCGLSQRVEFPFLCTNVQRGIAIWYEPYADPNIDKDIVQYAKTFGPNSFYARAPRIKDWQVFKAKLTELEGTLDPYRPKPKTSKDAEGALRGFIDSLRNNNNSETEHHVVPNNQSPGKHTTKNSLAKAFILPVLVIPFFLILVAEYMRDEYNANDFVAVIPAVFVAGTVSFLVFYWQRLFAKKVLFGFSPRFEKGVTRASILFGIVSATPLSIYLWENIDVPRYDLLPEL